MAATVITVEECNQTRTSIFLDSNVILYAKAGRGTFFADFNRIDRPLRLFSSTTLYEIAFARKAGLADGTLRENQSWISERANFVTFTERVGRKFDAFLGPNARFARGKVDLGDALLASFVRAGVDHGNFAIATNDRDFLHLPVSVVKEFLPP